VAPRGAVAGSKAQHPPDRRRQAAGEARTARGFAGAGRGGAFMTEPRVRGAGRPDQLPQWQAGS